MLMPTIKSLYDKYPTECRRQSGLTTWVGRSLEVTLDHDLFQSLIIKRRFRTYLVMFSDFPLWVFNPRISIFICIYYHCRYLQLMNIFNKLNCNFVKLSYITNFVIRMYQDTFYPNYDQTS